MDFKSVERDMTGDRERNQEATLPVAGDSVAGDPGAGDPGMCVPRASQSGVNSEVITLPGPAAPGTAAPGTRLPGTDGKLAGNQSSTKLKIYIITLCIYK